MHVSAAKRSTDFIALIDQLGLAYGTTERTRPLLAVLDNGPIHTSKLTTRALAQRPWITLEGLPKYAPELNDPGSDPTGANLSTAFVDIGVFAAARGGVV